MWLQAAMGLMGTLMDAQAMKSQIKYQEALRDADFTRQESQNRVKRTLQRINNKRIMQAADKNALAAEKNLRRLRERSVTRGLNQSIQFSEELGAYAANVSATNTLGASIDAIEGTMKLRQARQKQLQDTNDAREVYDAKMQIAGIMADAAASMDMTGHNPAMQLQTGLQMHSVTNSFMELGGLLGAAIPNLSFKSSPKGSSLPTSGNISKVPLLPAGSYESVKLL